MRPFILVRHVIIPLCFVLLYTPNIHAQLLKKLKKKAEQTAERKLEQKVEKETDKAMDTILYPNETTTKNEVPNNKPTTPTNPSNTSDITEPMENRSDNLEIYSKFDYVPGDKPIFFDDFSQDFVGDFPSKWNTNGTGEVVKLNKAEGNWFQLKAGYALTYIPLVDDKLPEEYTIEFDLFTEGLDKKTSSTARLYVTLDDNNGFSKGRDYATVAIPFGQYGAFGIQVRNTNSANNRISNTVTADVRNAVLNQPHVSIAVNKNRFRLWINQTKYVDIPQFIYSPEKMGYLKFSLSGLKDGKDHIFIKNLKIAEGGVDLRRKLMTEGRVSTNGILFDSGSANIKPQSFGIIRQISQVLMQDTSMRLNIVGHTDSDGNDSANMALSKKRADAVKNALISIYKISEDRLLTQGKGESEAVADNATASGKAQNRRVEFIKI